MASGTIRQTPFLIEAVSVASTETDSIAANTGADFTKDVSKTGYTPVGIVGVQKAGQSYANVFLTRFYLDGDTIHVSVYNSFGSSRTISITASVLYMKS